MKKNVLFIAIAMLLVLSMTVSFAACKKTPKEKETTTVAETTVPAASTSVEATTKAGETVTDASGKAVTNENVTELSVEEIEKDAPVAKNGTAGSLDDKAIDKMSDYKPKDTSNKRLKDNYKDLFKSKKLLMKVTLESTEEEDINGSSMLIAFNDKKTYCQYDFMGISIALLEANGKSYMLCPANKTYTIASSDITGGMGDVSGSVSDIVGDDDAEYIKTENATLNGKKLTCESYKSGDVIQKYYFDSTKLVRIETVDSTGKALMAVNIEKLTSDFDDSLFSIPRGYTPLTNTLFFTSLTAKYSDILGSLQ